LDSGSKVEIRERTSDVIPPLISAPVAERAMRVDARRNRQAVIEAARERMAAEGLDAQMTEIARAAGVGVGTVYRHFPTKDDLIEALAHDRFSRLADYAHDALAEDDPGPAFERFLYRAGELQAADRALSEVMRDRPEAMRTAADSVDLLELTRAALTRAQDAGAIRRDAEAEDIPMLMCGLGTSTPGCQGPFVSPTSWRRFMAIVIDGLRTGGTSPMPPR
jgi:AcrR family transcriptional regulator